MTFSFTLEESTASTIMRSSHEYSKPLLRVQSLTVPLEIQPSKTAKIFIHATYIHAVENYPKEINQNEVQLSRYYGNHYFYSPYKTEKVITKVTVPSTIIKHSVVNPTSSDKNTVTYGPYTNIGSKSLSTSIIHFTNDAPLITVNRLVREVEVSHWGNVGIEDFLFVTNDGAELKSGFSRLDYQMTQNQRKSVIEDLEFELPKDAANVYYRDHIGNISTSLWWGRRLMLEPRFPLFGGWKTKFCMGYDLPLNNHVEVHKENANLYTLTIPVGPHFEKEVVVDEHVIRVILPEGVTDINIEVPFKFDKQTLENRRTYLDIEGRVVVILEKNHLFNLHENAQLKITYKFSSTLMWREPLMLISGYFMVFLFFIITSRINLSLTPKAKAE